MNSSTKHTRRPRVARDSSEPALIQRLEGRLYLAHLGHEVLLPAAAASGDAGLQVVASTYSFADHRRSRLVTES